MLKDQFERDFKSFETEDFVEWFEKEIGGSPENPDDEIANHMYYSGRAIAALAWRTAIYSITSQLKEAK